MRDMTSADIAEVTGGRLIGAATGTERVFGKATVDSRTVDAGDLFVAFDGEHVDGHRFIASAFEAGAALALVTKEDASDPASPAVLVEDAHAALSTLAHHVLEVARAEGNAPTVIALTGSSGKTSTKDLLASILTRIAPTVAPVGSRNNELGLPLTVLEMDDRTRYLVLEMGARGIGHISHLTKIARPDIALVLNVGTAHVGEFGSVENTQRAKSELVTSLDAHGIAVLNADDPRVISMRPTDGAEVRSFSAMGNAEARAWASEVTLTDAATASFMLHLGAQQALVSLNLTGEHHVANALAAAAVADAADVDFAQIVEGLTAATQRSPGRMHVSELERDITLINDAYNANPDSTTAALKALAHLGRTRRTIAVLGEMLELGEGSVKAHDAIGRLAVRLNIAHLIVVGEGARAIHNGACLEGSFGGESTYVETRDEARLVLEKIAEPGDVIMLKSSNGVGLARLGEDLVHEWSKEGNERG